MNCIKLMALCAENLLYEEVWSLAYGFVFRREVR